MPDDLGSVVEDFKEQFTPAGGPDTSVDPTAIDADEMGDAESAKTLATE